MGKLSLLHEPLIVVFDQLEMLGLEHNRHILLNFGEAVKEIFTRVPHSLVIFNLFPHRWQQLQQIFDGSIVDRLSQYQVFLELPTSDEIAEILQLKAEAVGTDLTSLFTPQELQQIVNSNSIRGVLNKAAEYFRYKFKNIPLPDRNGKLEEEGDRETILSRLDRLEGQQDRLEQLLNNIARAFTIFVAPQSNDSDTVTNNFSSTERSPVNLIISPESDRSLGDRVCDYLQAQQRKLELDYQDAEILLDEKDVGKLQDIIEAFKQIAPLETDVLRTKRVLPPHRIISNKNLCIGFLSSCKGSKFTARIQNFNEFVATKEQIRFLLWRDVRSDIIQCNTVGSREIGKLSTAKNGDFKIFDRHTRIIFELIYKFISDVYNRDFELDIDSEFQPALKTVASYFEDYWLFEELL